MDVENLANPILGVLLATPCYKSSEGKRFKKKHLNLNIIICRFQLQFQSISNVMNVFPHTSPFGTWFAETVKLRKYTFAELTSGSEVGFLNDKNGPPSCGCYMFLLWISMGLCSVCCLFMYVFFDLLIMLFFQYFEFWAFGQATGRVFLMLLVSKDSRWR